MDELTQKFIEARVYYEGVYKNLMDKMREAGIKKIDLPDGSYLRLVEKPTSVAWYGRKFANKDIEESAE